MNRLKFENKTKNHVLGILKCAKIKMCDDVLFCKKTLNLFGEDIALKTVLLMKVMGKCTDNTEKIFIRAKNEPYKISMLDIDGNDILSLGYKGSEIGDVLEALLGRVMENPKLNNKGILLGILKDEFTD